MDRIGKKGQLVPELEDAKSEAMLSFEGRVAELRDRMERSELRLLEAVSEFRVLINEAIERVTEAERHYLLELELDAHRIGAEMLAEHGHPVPGNDPERPN